MLDKPYTKFPFFVRASIAIGIVVALLVALGLLVSPRIFFFGMALLLLLVAWSTFRIVQIIYEALFEKRHDFQQVGALFNLYARVQPKVRIPTLRSFASSPDFLNIILDEIARERPQTILELGSGVSTIFISEFLLDKGLQVEHLALDHETTYADLTRGQVRNPGTRVVHAPLAPCRLPEGEWQWYGLEGVELPSKIDLLIIDGPPALLQSRSRYPALPLLWERLSDRATIVADDAVRSEERESVRAWSETFPVAFTYLPTEKGTYLGRVDKSRAVEEVSGEKEGPST